MGCAFTLNARSALCRCRRIPSLRKETAKKTSGTIGITCIMCVLWQFRRSNGGALPLSQVLRGSTRFLLFPTIAFVRKQWVTMGVPSCPLPRSGLRFQDVEYNESTCFPFSACCSFATFLLSFNEINLIFQDKPRHSDPCCDGLHTPPDDFGGLRSTATAAPRADRRRLDRLANW